MISSWTCLPGCVVLHSTGLHQSKKMSIKKKSRNKASQHGILLVQYISDVFWKLLLIVKAQNQTALTKLSASEVG